MNGDELFDHVHNVLHLLAEGVLVAPETAQAFGELLIDFAEKAQPLLAEQLRADLLKTPPDDRDAKWRMYWAATERDES